MSTMDDGLLALIDSDEPSGVSALAAVGSLMAGAAALGAIGIPKTVWVCFASDGRFRGAYRLQDDAEDQWQEDYQDSGGCNFVRTKIPFATGTIELANNFDVIDHAGCTVGEIRGEPVRTYKRVGPRPGGVWEGIARAASGPGQLISDLESSERRGPPTQEEIDEADAMFRRIRR